MKNLIRRLMGRKPRYRVKAGSQYIDDYGYVWYMLITVGKDRLWVNHNDL